MLILQGSPITGGILSDSCMRNGAENQPKPPMRKQSSVGLTPTESQRIGRRTEHRGVRSNLLGNLLAIYVNTCLEYFSYNSGYHFWPTSGWLRMRFRIYASPNYARQTAKGAHGSKRLTQEYNGDRNSLGTSTARFLRSSDAGIRCTICAADSFSWARVRSIRTAEK